MKRKQTKRAALIALIAIASSAFAATEPTLKVGDPAPKLENGRYVQGEPVKAFQPGKAYIVEFWATWCGPCRASIPHLNDIYIKYKDKGLVVIGQDCSEEDDSKVEPFVKSMGDKMTYRVALDDKNGSKEGKMAETWMAAAGQNGIPCAFLVNTKGVIAWIGHPMVLEEKQDIIDQVLAGKYDVKKAASDYDKQLKEEEKETAAMEPLQEKMKAVSEAIRAQKWDEALADLAAAEKVIPEEKGEDMKINFTITRMRILLGKKDMPAAYRIASQLGDEQKENGSIQNFLAWELVTCKSIDKDGLELAQKLVDRAIKDTDGKDSASLDTQARVLFVRGQKEAAIEAQTKAVAMASPDDKADAQKTLDSYKKGQIPEDN